MSLPEAQAKIVALVEMYLGPIDSLSQLEKDLRQYVDLKLKSQDRLPRKWDRPEAADRDR